MRKLIVCEFMSLDGVGQAPGGKDEDPSGGFAHGGWHMRYMDELADQWVTKSIVGVGGFLLGRRTYEIFAAYWPTAPEEAQDFARSLNTLPKYVASRTLTGPLAWQHSTVLQGDLAEAVHGLKQAEGGDLVVIGSLALVQSLADLELIDEYRLMIDPLVLGGGKRVFRDDGRLRAFRLVDSQVTSTGALLATYATAAA